MVPFDPKPGRVDGRVDGLSVEPLPNFEELGRELPVNRELFPNWLFPVRELLLPKRELLFPNRDDELPVRLDEPNRFELPNERFTELVRFIELPLLRPNELRELLLPLRPNELRDEPLCDDPLREELPPRRD